MEEIEIRCLERWRGGRVDGRKRRRHQCRGSAESCPWPGAEPGETQSSSALGTADNNSARVMETDDYRRQGAGTSSRGTSVAEGRGAETVGSPLWIPQYVRWCIRQAMANASRLRGAPARSTPGTRRRGRYSEDAALIGRRCSGREALPRSLNSAVLPLALFFFGPCRSPPR